jgi:hypothetical protein
MRRGSECCNIVGAGHVKPMFGIETVLLKEVAMPTRRGVEQEIAANKQSIAQLEQQLKEIKDYITTNERAWQSASEPLRSITQEGLTKARANLAQQEIDLQRTHADLGRNQKILSTLEAIETLQQYIDKYSELLEKARSDLAQKEQELVDLTSPVNVPAYELLIPGGGRAALPTDRANMLIGCRDTANNIFPDIDLTPFGGQTSGASRKHARLSYANGQWTIVDLDSVNGTFVNEARIAPNVPTPVQDRAQLRFGKIALTFQPASAGRTARLS